jgi:hypothetical protein
MSSWFPTERTGLGGIRRLRVQTASVPGGNSTEITDDTIPSRCFETCKALFRFILTLTWRNQGQDCIMIPNEGISPSYRFNCQLLKYKASHSSARS